MENISVRKINCHLPQQQVQVDLKLTNNVVNPKRMTFIGRDIFVMEGELEKHFREKC